MDTRGSQKQCAIPICNCSFLQEKCQVIGSQKGIPMSDLIAEIEALKENLTGRNPWQEGYLMALDRAIAIIQKHTAGEQTGCREALEAELLRRESCARIGGVSGEKYESVITQCDREMWQAAYERNHEPAAERTPVHESSDIHATDNGVSMGYGVTFSTRTPAGEASRTCPDCGAPMMEEECL